MLLPPIQAFPKFDTPSISSFALCLPRFSLHDCSPLPLPILPSPFPLRCSPFAPHLILISQHLSSPMNHPSPIPCLLLYSRLMLDTAHHHASVFHLAFHVQCYFLTAFLLRQSHPIPSCANTSSFTFDLPHRSYSPLLFPLLFPGHIDHHTGIVYLAA